MPITKWCADKSKGSMKEIRGNYLYIFQYGVSYSTIFFNDINHSKLVFFMDHQSITVDHNLFYFTSKLPEVTWTPRLHVDLILKMLVREMKSYFYFHYE